MTQLTNQKIALIKKQTQSDEDEQTLILIKEIESLKKALGNSRSHFKKNQAIYGFHTKSMQGNAFANGVNVVRKLFPQLPKLTIDKQNQTISIYEEEKT